MVRVPDQADDTYMVIVTVIIIIIISYYDICIARRGARMVALLQTIGDLYFNVEITTK